MISICLATKQRPLYFKNMCLSALDNAKNKDDIEFVSYHDIWDKSVYGYFGKHKELVGEPQILSRMINDLRKVAEGDILMFTCDDFMFTSKNWDEEVLNAFAKFDDRIAFVAPDNTDWNRWGFGVVGFLHRNWINAVGYFMPTYLGEATDRWINDVALMINRRVKLDTMTMHHLNVQDAVHADKKKICLKNKWNQRYGEYAEQRKLDAERLSNAIENYYLLHSQQGTA